MRRSLLATVIVAVALIGATTPVAGQEALGSISGTVTDATTGQPVPDTNVELWGVSSGGVFTNADGTYIFRNLSPGVYFVETGNMMMFQSDYVHTWWPGVSEYQDAGEVIVVAGQETANIDFQLELGGVVSGTVTNAWTGEPVEGVAPCLEEDWKGTWVNSTCHATTSADGSYRVAGLAGEYRLSFVDWDGGDYLTSEEVTFDIEPGGSLVLDFEMTPAYGTPFAMVAGVACEAGDSGDCWGEEADRLAGQAVEARDGNGTLLGTTVTDSWGGFYLENLVPGRIIVSLDPPPGMVAESIETTLGPNEGAWDIQLEATRVFVRHALSSSVGPTQIEPGSESDIHLEAVFAGVVDSVAPFDVTGVVVSLHLPEGLSYVGHAGYGTFDPNTGLWSIPSLRYLSRADMTITVTAQEEGTYRPHAEILASDWPDQYTLFGDGLGSDYTEVALTVAAPVVVAEETSIGGVAWEDVDSDGVQDNDELGIVDITILATAADGTVFATTTNNDGQYEFIGLSPGTYRIEPDPATVPEGMEAPGVVFVFEVAPGSVATANFGFTEIAGLSGWWITGLILGAALLIGLAYWFFWMRRRVPPMSPETSEPAVSEEPELASSHSTK